MSMCCSRLYVGITEPHGMGREFEITGVGILIFMVGVAIERLLWRATIRRFRCGRLFPWQV